MKVFIVLAALVAIAVARPTQEDANATILRSSDESSIGNGAWSYSVETSNGIKQEESGQLVNPGQENESIAVRGSFTYTAPDGQPISVSYVADENGFQPQGAHLPA